MFAVVALEGLDLEVYPHVPVVLVEVAELPPLADGAGVGAVGVGVPPVAFLLEEGPELDIAADVGLFVSENRD